MLGAQHLDLTSVIIRTEYHDVLGITEKFQGVIQRSLCKFQLRFSFNNNWLNLTRFPERSAPCVSFTKIQSTERWPIRMQNPIGSKRRIVLAVHSTTICVEPDSRRTNGVPGLCDIRGPVPGGEYANCAFMSSTF